VKTNITISFESCSGLQGGTSAKTLPCSSPVLTVELG